MNALDISASALSAQRTRMSAIAGNIANAGTTRDADGKPAPYRRLEVLFASGAPGASSAEKGGPGVRVQAVREDRQPFRWAYEPTHPDAVRDPSSDRNGYVLLPRINVVEEMVDMMLASRAYEANLSAIEVTKAMHSAALRILA
jgi:flagellar basal-body rod protein FlgC